MRVKVGDSWFEVTKDTPVMVVLSEEDKRNITSMLPEATRYATFADDSALTKDEKLRWMDDDDARSPLQRAVDKARGGPAPTPKRGFA